MVWPAASSTETGAIRRVKSALAGAASSCAGLPTPSAVSSAIPPASHVNSLRFIGRLSQANTLGTRSPNGISGLRAWITSARVEGKSLHENEELTCFVGGACSRFQPARPSSADGTGPASLLDKARPEPRQRSETDLDVSDEARETKVLDPRGGYRRCYCGLGGAGSQDDSLFPQNLL